MREENRNPNPELNEAALENAGGGTSSESYAKHAQYLCLSCMYKYNKFCKGSEAALAEYMRQHRTKLDNWSYCPFRP